MTGGGQMSRQQCFFNLSIGIFVANVNIYDAATNFNLTAYIR
jgi:hypothetical protein